jgi:hypothetical protein
MRDHTDDVAQFHEALPDHHAEAERIRLKTARVPVRGSIDRGHSEPAREQRGDKGLKMRSLIFPAMGEKNASSPFALRGDPRIGLNLIRPSPNTTERDALAQRLVFASRKGREKHLEREPPRQRGGHLLGDSERGMDRAIGNGQELHGFNLA